VREAAPASGRFLLVLFSHTSGGHRRQCSFLCTHLASHGYVVAAADHAGNTAADIVARAKRTAAGDVLAPDAREARVRQMIADRVPDLRLLCDRLLSGAAKNVAGQLDAVRVGLVGYSFGGWAVLAALEVDERFGAVVALAPGGSSNPVPGTIPVTLTFEWRRPAPALYLVAERDRFTPLAGMYELFERTPASKRMFVLGEAGHLHFGDDIDEDDLCPRQHARLFTRGLALAHLDTALKDSDEARRFLTDDPAASLRARGVAAIEYAPGGRSV
jgi:dienelactone hydrolase